MWVNAFMQVLIHAKSGHDRNEGGSGKKFFFGISSSCIWDWDGAAAFREIYQNWWVICCLCEGNALKLF